MNFHFLETVSVCKYRQDKGTHHLECIKLLFDLLSEHRSQAVACCNFTSSIILSTRPGIMKLNPRAEANVTGSSSSNTTGSARHALRFSLSESPKGEEVIFALYGNRVGSTVSKTWWLVFDRGAWCTRARRIIETCGWSKSKSRLIGLGINRSKTGRGVAGISAVACEKLITFNDLEYDHLRFKMPFFTAARTSARSISPPTMLRLDATSSLRKMFTGSLAMFAASTEFLSSFGNPVPPPGCS